MCGIIGIIGAHDVASEIYDGLMVLQHRGQDAAGIITYDGKKMHLKKGEGLVCDIFQDKDMERLKGSIGMGHNRYPTTISHGSIEEAQPFIVHYPYGISIAHNGNVINYDTLKKELLDKDKRFVNSRSDSELILHVFASALEKNKVQELKPNHIWSAVHTLYSRVKGAYALIFYIAGQGMVALRDPYGIKPLVWGRRKTSLIEEYMFASESVALDSLGFELIRDIDNGEAIFINHKRQIYTKKFTKKPLRPCVFEYIYFARPDSMLDNISVYKTRLRLGESLAHQIKKGYKPIDADSVVPVPESARSSALGLSTKLKIKYREGLVKNRYIGRTFIMAEQKKRQESIRRKLNAQELEIKNRNIMLVDDSIVRGNTSSQIVQLLKKTGAKKVHFVSSAPPIKFPCFYGIDFPTRKELIAHNRTIPEIAKILGADILTYQTIEDTKNSVSKVKGSKIRKPCMACFDGEYATGGITEKTFVEIERKRDLARIELEKKYGKKQEGIGMF